MARHLFSERRLKRLFEDDPARRLIAAVMLSAVDDMRGVGGSSVSSQEARIDAATWFQSDERGVLSFVYCAEAFGVTADEARKLFRANPSARRVSSSTRRDFAAV